MSVVVCNSNGKTQKYLVLCYVGNYTLRNIQNIMKSLFYDEAFEIDESLKISSLSALFSDIKKDSGWGEILKKFSKTDEFIGFEHKP
jgi:hypothetical protein